jgi:hypothetical protein
LAVPHIIEAALRLFALSVIWMISGSGLEK